MYCPGYDTVLNRQISLLSSCCWKMGELTMYLGPPKCIIPPCIAGHVHRSGTLEVAAVVMMLLVCTLFSGAAARLLDVKRVLDFARSPRGKIASMNRPSLPVCLFWEWALTMRRSCASAGGVACLCLNISRPADWSFGSVGEPTVHLCVWRSV